MITPSSTSMSMAETYFLASQARTKLTREARRNDHNLRVLVSHANLLDNLMDALTKKRTAGVATAPATTYSRPISMIEEEDEADEEEYSDEEYSDEDDFDDEEDVKFEAVQTSVTPNLHAHEIQVTEISDSDSESDDDDQETSYTISSVTSSEGVPSLSYSSEEESEDELRPTQVMVVVDQASKEYEPTSVGLSEATQIVSCAA